MVKRIPINLTLQEWDDWADDMVLLSATQSSIQPRVRDPREDAASPTDLAPERKDP